jgi:SAM-dependent methyltransferase
MSGGTSLALQRRLRDPRFAECYFVGDAIDIGAGPDSLGHHDWPNLRSVRDYDKQQGDAALMAGVEPESYDLVYSSHALEHIDQPGDVLRRWWRLVKPGGHLVLVVPDEDLYEQRRWPPAQNSDHRNTYTLHKPDRWSLTKPGWESSSWSPVSVNLLSLAMELPACRIVRAEWLEAGFDYAADVHDQTATQTCECGIEIVLRKEKP